MTWTLRITELGRPPTLNAERSAHWGQHRASTREWREAGMVHALAERVPTLGRVRVTYWPTYPDRRGIPDLGGVFPAVKAVVDGLVDAGVLADDDEGHVAELVARPAEIGGPAGLVVEVEGL